MDVLESPSGDYHNEQPYHGGGRSHNQPRYTEKLFSDRKIFFMDLKENDRGRFVKITEDVRGRSSRGIPRRTQPSLSLLIASLKLSRATTDCRRLRSDGNPDHSLIELARPRASRAHTCGYRRS
ncbi:MAG: hypothetical protein ACI9MB_000959 [Verrucomicrobiales bacterium]|jgi:hypothetical protein